MLDQLNQKPVLYLRQRLSNEIWVISDFNGSNATQLTMLDRDLEFESIDNLSSTVPILDSKTIMRVYNELIQSFAQKEFNLVIDDSRIIDLNIYSVEHYLKWNIFDSEKLNNLQRILNFRNLLLMSLTDINQLSSSQYSILKELIRSLSSLIYEVAADLLNLIIFDSNSTTR